MTTRRTLLTIVLALAVSSPWTPARGAEAAGEEEKIIPLGADDDNSGPTPAEPTPPPATVSTPVDTEDEDDSDWFQDLDVDAFLSAAYVHNFAFSNPSGLNTGRLFDQQDDSFKLDVATLTVEWKARRRGNAGFRLDISHGMVVPVVLGGIDVAVLQAYGRYIIPVGRGLTVDFGSFLSRIGSETVEGYETINAAYSHGFIFTLFTPPTLTGLRVSYAWSKTAQLTVWVVNGWRANVLDNNAGKTLGAQLQLGASDELRVNVSYLAGPEQPGINSHWRQIVNAYVEARPEDFITARLEGTYGAEPATNAATTQWWALAAVLQLQADVVGCTLRGEYVNNAGGFANLAADMVEWTVSPSVRLHEAFLVRADVRQDRALNGVQLFGSPSNNFSSQQTTVSLNAILAY